MSGPSVQDRRRFLAALSAAAAAAVIGPSHSSAQHALETTTIRLAKHSGICIAPQYIADELLAACQKGQTSHGELASVGLKVVNSYLFPPGRAWLKALGG